MGFHHANTVENDFSILKRGGIGTFHHVSEQHLARCLAEFDFRYSHRSGWAWMTRSAPTKFCTMSAASA